MKYIKMSNEYCEGDIGLLKYNTVEVFEDCWMFLVVKFIILSAISDTWGLGVRVRNSFS